MKTYFRVNRNKIRLQKKKTKSGKSFWTAGSNWKKLRGSLIKRIREGVPVNPDRWIYFGRPKTKARERERAGRRNSAYGGDSTGVEDFSPEILGKTARGSIGLGVWHREQDWEAPNSIRPSTAAMDEQSKLAACHGGGGATA